MQTFYFSNLLIDETVLRSEKKRIPFRSHRLAGNTTRGFVHIKASTSKKGKNEKENKETLIFCNEKKSSHINFTALEFQLQARASFSLSVQAVRLTVRGASGWMAAEEKKGYQDRYHHRARKATHTILNCNCNG